MSTKNAINTNYPIEVAAGGTGRASLTDHGVLVGATTSGITQLTVGTNGQALLGSTGADPVFATITSTGGSITFATGAGTLNMEANGMAVVEVTGTSQQAAVNTEYLTNNAGLVTVTLPSSAAVGAKVAVTGSGSGGWRLAQNAGQTVHFLGQNTTTGAGGRLDSTVRYDCVEVICNITDTDWVVKRSMGNITVT